MNEATMALAERFAATRLPQKHNTVSKQDYVLVQTANIFAGGTPRSSGTACHLDAGPLLSIDLAHLVANFS